MALRTIDSVGSIQQQTHPASTGDHWHTQTVAQTAQFLSVDPAAGLPDAEVQKRLEQYGTNELEEKSGRTPLDILREQLLNPLVLLLIGAAVVSGVLGKLDSLIAISAIVILNAILGVVQEYRAEQAMAALKKMAAPLVRVRRGNSVQDVPAANLVPGDIVLLEAGSVVPADGRLLEAANLRVAEAALTGESQPVEKAIEALQDASAPIGDRHNMVYMGTSVTYGRGSAIVTGTGMKTQLGRIAELIQTVDAEKTPLQHRLDELGKVLFGAANVVMVIAFIIGLIAGVPLVPPADDPKAESVLLNAVAIAVAVVPEGLPAVVTIALALGARRMLRRNALIRKLAAVETLGSVTVICSDKTGTLTENKMTVTLIDVAGRTAQLKDVIIEHDSKQIVQVIHDAQMITLFGSSLCSDVVVQTNGSTHQAETLGDPTEVALVMAARGLHMVKTHLDDAFPRVGEVPFDSDRKRMSTIHNPAENIELNDEERQVMGLLGLSKDTYVVFSKGAVDSLLTVSGRVWVEDKILPMSEDWRQRIEKDNSQLAADGLRVLGLAYRILPAVPEKPTVENIENDLVFVGMVGIIDPPRAEVPAAVATAKTAGIRPIMITGDHPMTALAIAKQIGMAQAGDKVLTGHDLTRMNETELREAVKTVSVYARVSPENKLQIVQALQANGEVTAMTGDGVNDAPALKRSNIGVAMGITGTAVSKEASDTVLLDDNFATIVSAVEEGRTIYDNVRRFIKYLLASNTGELFVLLAPQLVAGMGLPLTTLQILWMNLITDGIPALALGVENPERGAMQRKPYLPNESLFGRGLGRHIVIVGLVLGLTGLGLGVWAFNNYNIEASNIMGITIEQLVAAENSQVHITELDKVAEEAARIGITPEQLIQIHDGVDTHNYHANTWNTMVFMFLTLAQMGHALGLRSHTDSLFSLSLFGNRLLIGAVVVTIILQLLAIYTPFFNTIFNTTALSLEQLLICVVLSSVVFIAVELEKLFIRRKIIN